MNYEQQLLDAWESSNKQGQLTLWVFLALFERARTTAEIRSYLLDNTDGVFSVDDKSLYRSLRRYADAEMVDYLMKPSENGGPPLKVYSLTPLGKNVLTKFIKRNIQLFIHNDQVKEILR